MNILVYIPKKTTKRVNNDWLYGSDVIKKLKDRHPEWNFICVDGSKKNIYENIDVYLRPNRHDGYPLMIAEAKLFGIPYIWSYETGKYIEPNIDDIEKRLIKLHKELKMAQRGHPGRGGKGSCGGTRKRDGSGKGVGNKNTSRQSTKKKK